MAQSTKEAQSTLAQTNFEKFDPDTMDNMVNLEECEMFCEMVGIPVDKKVIIFITSIGHQLDSLLRDLFSPKLVKEQSLEEICKKLSEHYQ